MREHRETSGPLPIRKGRQAKATIAATVTGMKLRGFHSNSSNSTASSTAAIGVPNTAVMPAAAPATSRRFALRRAADEKSARTASPARRRS